jgi:Mn-containing catalase
MPMNSNGASWNMDFVTTTGNVIIDLLHNFHLECGARLHKLRVYETLTDPTGREVCGYLLVRGGVHAHAYALALEKLTGVDIKKMLPTPNINLDKIPESQKYLEEGSHRRLYRFSADDYKEMAGIWQGEEALPGDPPGTLEVVDGPPTGGKSRSSKELRQPSHLTTRPKRCSRSRPSYTGSRGEQSRQQHRGRSR